MKKTMIALLVGFMLVPSLSFAQTVPETPTSHDLLVEQLIQVLLQQVHILQAQLVAMQQTQDDIKTEVTKRTMPEEEPQEKASSDIGQTGNGFTITSNVPFQPKELTIHFDGDAADKVISAVVQMNVTPDDQDDILSRTLKSTGDGDWTVDLEKTMQEISNPHHLPTEKSYVLGKNGKLKFEVFATGLNGAAFDYSARYEDAGDTLSGDFHKSATDE